MKTQTVRLIDVFALGPFMIYAALKARGLSPIEQAFLGFSGLATIIYNGANYLQARELGIDESWHVEALPAPEDTFYIE